MSIWRTSAKCRKSKEILSYPLMILFFVTDKIGLQMWNRRHYNGLESKLSIKEKDTVTNGRSSSKKDAKKQAAYDMLTFVLEEE